MVSGRWLAVALAVALAGCTAAEGTAVGVEIYAADGVLHEGVLGGPADTLELVLEAGDERLVEEFDLAAGRGRVTSVPVGSGYRFTARGFVGAESTVLFYGASHPFDVDAGDDVTVPVMVGRAGCVGLNKMAASRDRGLGGTADLQDRRVGASVTRLLDGRVLVLGGAEVDAMGRPERILDTAEVFDPVANQMVKLPWRLVVPRAFHSATVLPDGQVLVVGGVIAPGSPLTVTETAALVDVDSVEGNRPLPVGLPVDPRAWHEALLLPDGSVLVAGGERGDGTPVATAARFLVPPGSDAIEGRFRLQGPMHAARSRFTMTAVARASDPAVLAGGLGMEGAEAGVEVFSVNPAQGGCAGGGSPTDGVGCFVVPNRVALPEARWGHVAVPVAGGVVFAGGYGSVDRTAPVASVVRLDTSAFTIAEVTRLGTPRGELAAAAVDEGDAQTVLLVGGRVGETPVRATSRLVPAADGSWGEEPVAENCELSEARFGLRAVTLDNRTVLLLGGANQSPAGLVGSRRVEVFFPRVNVF